MIKKMIENDIVQDLVALFVCLLLLAGIGFVTYANMQPKLYCQDMGFDYVGDGAEEGYVVCCYITYENHIRSEKDECVAITYNMDGDD